MRKGKRNGGRERDREMKSGIRIKKWKRKEVKVKGKEKKSRQ